MTEASVRILVHSPSEEIWLGAVGQTTGLQVALVDTKDLDACIDDPLEFLSGFDLIHSRLYLRPIAAAVRSEIESAFAAHEWLNVMLAASRMLPDERFLNPPVAAMLAESKPHQLRLAASLGFRVPRWRMTNNPDRMREFVSSLDGEAVFKPIDNSIAMNPASPQDQLLLFTRTITSDQISDDPEFARKSPIILQERIAKLYEIRIVVLGDEVRIIKIDSQKHAGSSVDFRRRLGDSSLYSMIEDEWCIGPDCVAYCRAMGITMGTFDVAIASDGRPVFLECNPNGQWASMDRSAGGDIQAVASRHVHARLRMRQAMPRVAGRRSPDRGVADPHVRRGSRA